jgi:hypothetical protein
MTLAEAVTAALKVSRVELAKDERGSDLVQEVRIPIKEWSAVMNAWREERTQQIARQGLKELREAIYGESK